MPKGAQHFVKKYTSIGLTVMLVSSQTTPILASETIDVNEGVEIVEVNEDEEVEDEKLDLEVNDSSENKESKEEENIEDNDEIAEEFLDPNSEEKPQEQENQDTTEQLNEVNKESKEEKVNQKQENIQGLSIEEIKLDKKEAIEGSKIKVTAKLKDDKSINVIYVYFNNGNNSSDSAYLSYNSRTGLYEGELEPSSFDINGNNIYEISSFDIYYDDGSYKSINKEILSSEHGIVTSELSYEVKSIDLEVSDIQISLNKNEVVETEYIDIEASLNSNKPVDSIRVNFSGHYSSNATLKYNKSTQKYEGKVRAGSFEEGYNSYSISSIVVNTTQGSGTINKESLENDYSVDTSKLSYEIIKLDLGITSMDINIEKNEVVENSKLKVEALIETTKKINNITVYFKDSQYNDKYAYLYYQESTGKYEGEFDVEDYVENGDNTYKLDHIYLSMDNNYKRIYSKELESDYNIDLNKLTYSITKSILDIKSIDIRLGKREVVENTNFDIYANVECNEDIKEIKVKYSNGAIYTLKYNEAKGRYEGSIHAPAYKEHNSYNLEEVTVLTANGGKTLDKDTLKNEYNVDLSVLSYDVIKLDLGIKSIDISIDKSEVIENSNLKVEALIDVTNKLRSIVVYFSNSEGQTKQATLNYNESTGKYEGSIGVGDWQENKSNTYKLDYLNITTDEGNRRLYSEELAKDYNLDLSKLTYSIKPYTLDLKLIDIKLGKQEVVENTYFDIYANVESNEEINEIEVKYSNGSTNTLTYDVANGRYEGRIYSYSYNENSNNKYDLEEITIYTANGGKTLDKDILSSEYKVDLSTLSYEVVKLDLGINSIDINMEKTEAVENSKFKVEVLVDTPKEFNYIQLQFRNSQNESVNETLYYKESTGTYEGEIEVRSYIENGDNTYKLDNVSVSTSEGSRTLSSNELEKDYNLDLNKLKFNVTKYTLDLKSIDIKLGKQEVVENTHFDIYANVESNEEINEIEVKYSNGLTNTLTYDAANGRYEGSIYSYSYKESGNNKYDLEEITIYTANGGKTLDKDILSSEYKVDLSTLSYEVVKLDLGINSIDINMEKTEAVENSKFKVEVLVDTPKEFNYIQLQFRNLQNESVNETLSYKESTGKYEGEIEVRSYIENGDNTYKLDNISVSTSEGSRTLSSNELEKDYNLDLNKLKFNVTKYTLDLKSIDIKLGKQEVVENTSFDIYANIESNEEIKEIKVKYSNGRTNTLTYDAANGRYEGRIYSYSYNENGNNKYNLEEVTIYTANGGKILDKDTLKSEYKVDLEKLNYEVIEYDLGINSMNIEIDNNDVSESSEINVVVQLDTQNKFNYIQVLYHNNEGNADSAVLYYNELTKKYEGSIKVNDYLPGKENIYNISYITFNTDVASKSLDRNDLEKKYGIDASSLSYKVNEYYLDIESIKINQDVTEVIENGRVSVSMDIKSNIKLNSIDINYKNSKGEMIEGKLYYDYQSKQYKDNINIGDSTEYGVDDYYLDSITLHTDKGSEKIEKNELKNNYNVDVESHYISVNEIKVNVDDLSINDNIYYENMYQDDSKVSISLESNSEINYVDILYSDNLEGDYVTFFNLSYNEKTGKYEGDIDYLDNFRNNTVYMYGLEIYTDNGLVELSREDIVDAQTLDIKKEMYEPINIQLDKSTINAGDKAKISVDVSNYPNEIDKVQVFYSKTGKINLSYNENTKMYEGYYDSAVLGKLQNSELTRIKITDKNDGYCIVSNEYTDLSQGDISITSKRDEIVKNLSISVDKNEVSAQETATYVIKGIDPSLTGRVTILNKETKKYEQKHIYYNKSKKQHEVYFDTNKYTNKGEWIIKNIYLMDKEDNHLTIKNERLASKGYTKNFDSVNINVVDTIEDTKAPELKSIEVSKKEVTSGDTLKVSLDIEDDVSGIDEVQLVYSDEEQNIDRLVEAKYNPNSKKYEASIDINSVTIEGDYKLLAVRIIDKADNTHIIYDDFVIGNREIKETIKDLSSGDYKVVDTVQSVSENVKSINIGENEVQVRDNLDVSVELKDNTGISKIELLYYSEWYYDERTISLEYNEKSNRYEGKLYIDENMDKDLWYIDQITLFDDKGEFLESDGIDYYEFYHANFIVVSERSEGLTLDSIAVDEKKLTKNESSNIEVNASDIDGEIEKVFVKYKSEDNNTKDIELNKDGDIFKGKFSVGEYDSSGVWKIESVTLEDNERNRKTIFNTSSNFRNISDFSSCNIEVYGTTKDSFAPKFTNISFDKNSIKSGESVTASIKASDDVSGIKSIKAKIGYSKYIDNEMYDETELIEFKYNAKTNMYEYELTYENHDFLIANNTIFISSIELEDNAGNTRNISYDNSYKLFKTRVEVSLREFSISDITNKSSKITGYSEPHSTIKIKIGNEVYETKANEIGYYEVEIKTPKAYEDIEITFTNTVGTIIKSIASKVLDVIPPEIPTVDRIDTNTEVIKGKAEANSTVVISIDDKELGRVKASENGEYSLEIQKQKVGAVVSIYAIDLAGNESERLQVKVEPGQVIINKAPEIIAKDQEINKGDEFDPLKGVSAKDFEDGDITDKVEVVENTVDTDIAGEYKVVYKVTDSQGASVKKEIKVTVTDLDIDIDPDKDPDTDTDTDKETPDEDKDNNTNTEVPQTGDKSILSYVGVGIASVAGLLFGNKKRKNK